MHCLISVFIHAKLVNYESHPVVFYLHPREIDPEQPRLNLSKRDTLIHYFGIKGCQKKFEKVIKNFDCGAIRDVLDLS